MTRWIVVAVVALSVLAVGVAVWAANSSGHQGKPFNTVQVETNPQ